MLCGMAPSFIEALINLSLPIRKNSLMHGQPTTDVVPFILGGPL